MIASLQFCSFHRQADTLLCMIARIFHLEVLGQYGLSKIQPTTGAWSEWQRNVHDQSDSKNFNSTIDSIIKTQWRKQSGNPSSSQRSRQGQWTRKGPVPSQGEEPKSRRAKDAKAKDAKSETKRTELFANEPKYGAMTPVVWWSKTLSTEWEKSISCKAAKFQKVEIKYESIISIFRIGGCVMNPSRKIKTLQDAKRSELYSSETYGDEYGKRAERANVIKFILAIFGIRTNKKVRERRETNTM